MPIYVCEYCRREYNTRDLLKRITPHATAESRAREARRRGSAIRVRPAPKRIRLLKRIIDGEGS